MDATIPSSSSLLRLGVPWSIYLRATLTFLLALIEAMFLLALVEQPSQAQPSNSTNDRKAVSGMPISATSAYPDVWWRQVKGSLHDQHLHLMVEERYAKTPHLIPEIYVHVQSPNLPLYTQPSKLMAFFSGKTVAVRKVTPIANEVLHYELADGRQLDLRGIGEQSSSTSDGEGASNQKPLPPQRYRVEQISAFGGLIDEKAGSSNDPVRTWVHPSVLRAGVLDQPMLSCDPFYWGLQAFDPQAKRIWQNVIVAYGPPVLRPMGPAGRSGFAPYYNECWTPGQQEMATAEAFGPVLRDDTILLVLGQSGYGDLGILRIRLKDGRPARLPANVSILGYAGVMRMKAVLADVNFERSKIAYDAGVRRSDVRNYGEPNEFLILQNYFFPNLASALHASPKSNSRANQSIQGSPSK